MEPIKRSDSLDRLLLYGANGYTGELIARIAVSRGQRPILAGRNREALAALGQRFGLPIRVFGLDSPGEIQRNLQGVQAVLHCAGPFSQTSKPMVDACLQGRVHYLDITGEIAVFEACSARNEEAKRQGIMLLPGVGFDVVPSDCLAQYVARRVPKATHLALAFQSSPFSSRGTMATSIEGMHAGRVRKEGHLVVEPIGARVRSFDLGPGVKNAKFGMSIPWGDVSTAYFSTGIPNIEVYLIAPLPMRLSARFLPLLSPILRNERVKQFLKAQVHKRPPGPSDDQRRDNQCYLYAEASTATEKFAATLRTPEGYTLTALSALTIAGSTLLGDFKVGYQTPSSAYGPDLILNLDYQGSGTEVRCKRTDLLV